MLFEESESNQENIESLIEARFLKMLEHHLEGWRQKVLNDFSEKAFQHELTSLAGDPVYSNFGLASPHYVMIRLIGRMSISIGRRLGEIYDKTPRYVVMARFNLTAEQVIPKLKNLELDVQILNDHLTQADKDHIANVSKKFNIDLTKRGLGIEIRYNFNPNDSSRLRKDEDMARYLQEEGITPVYLIFSNISPRDEAIARLKRAGWTFLVGEEAINFMKELANMDIESILTKEKIKNLIQEKVNQIMKDIFTSYGFSQLNIKGF